MDRTITEKILSSLQQTADLTTAGQGVNSDAEPLALFPPRLEKRVPGYKWEGRMGLADTIMRLPAPEYWNGKIMIGATPAVRNEFSLDLLLSDLVLQRGYAYAACDKGTPHITLRDPARSLSEWETNYETLTRVANDVVTGFYKQNPTRTYISGVSNGGYITRLMLERHPGLYDGGVEWEGVLWHPSSQHLLRDLPIYLLYYPIYRNWRGDRTDHEKHRAFERLVGAGLHPESEPYWEQYYLMYWIVSLWLYGFALDPTWIPFQAIWSNDWLRDPSFLADYPFEERSGMINHRISSIANTGRLQKPLLSLAGNWDCLVTFDHHAKAYEALVNTEGSSSFHRLYEIGRGNHVDGLLKTNQGRQQPVLPFYEAALYHLEVWAEKGVLPPDSAAFEHVRDFSRGFHLFSYP